MSMNTGSRGKISGKKYKQFVIPENWHAYIYIPCITFFIGSVKRGLESLNTEVGAEVGARS